VIDGFDHRTTASRLPTAAALRYKQCNGGDFGWTMQQLTDGEWHAAGASAALAEGGVLGASAGAHRVAIYRREGRLHATDGLCTHAWVPLEDGLLDGFEIECPVHQARFDIRSGACTAFPAQHPLRTFPVREAEGRIEVFVARGLPSARRDVPRRTMGGPR